MSECILKFNLQDPDRLFASDLKYLRKFGTKCTLLVQIAQKYMIFCTQFSAQKAGNRILGHWCTPTVPSRRRGVKASFWYSRLHFSNLLATSIFIETPGSLQEIATLAMILEISDSNLETGRYSSKSGVSLIISVELTALVLVYHVSGGTEHIYLNKVPLGVPKTWGVLDKVWEALPLGPTP